ncbi:MAG: winged helix-turn-helix transcriptional regulator, partial [Jatrophihabitantaceae bacterium]
RDLEAAGIVRRDLLDPPASVAVYVLTDRGRALEPVLVELGRWGRAEPIVTGNDLSVDAFALALKTTFRPMFDASYALCIDAEWFTLTVHGELIDLARGRDGRVDTTLDGDARTLRGYAFGRISFDDAERAGLSFTGNRTLARRFPKLFVAG